MPLFVEALTMAMMLINATTKGIAPSTRSYDNGAIIGSNLAVRELCIRSSGESFACSLPRFPASILSMPSWISLKSEKLIRRMTLDTYLELLVLCLDAIMP